jgi:hypothetical protein
MWTTPRSSSGNAKNRGRFVLKVPSEAFELYEFDRKRLLPQRAGMSTLNVFVILGLASEWSGS